MNKKLKNVAAYLLAGFMTVTNLIGTGVVYAESSADLDEGEMCLQKKAEPVPGKANTWRITVTAECKDKAKPKDYILIVDKSGSMNTVSEGGETRISLAKDAANQLVENIYENDDRNRVAVISYSSPPVTDINNYTGDYKTGNHSNKDIGFTGITGESAVMLAIDGITATGGTYTQLALHEAQEMAKTAHDADTKEERDRIIILLTDGLPTLSTSIDWTAVGADAYERTTVTEYHTQGQYVNTSTGEKYYINPDTGAPVAESKVPAGATWPACIYPTLGSVPQTNVLTTNENIPENAFNYTDAKIKTNGYGVNRWVKQDDLFHNGEQVYIDNLGSTIAETNFIREKGDAKDLYVIGFDVSASDAAAIKKLAGDDEHYVNAKGTGVADAMQKILERTSVPDYEATVLDEIPVGFTQPDEIEISCGTVSYNSGVLTWNVGTPNKVKPNTEPIERYATMSYTLSVEDGHAFEENELFKTNGRTEIEYNNPKWPGEPTNPEPKRTTASVNSPEVEVSKIKVTKTVTNNADCEREFVIRVTDPKGRLIRMTLKHGENDFTTKFTEVGTYKILEMVNADGYDVSYFVNGVEADSFVINEVTDVKKSQTLNIEVRNTAKAFNESYQYLSATPGEDLPQAVLDLLPTGRTGLLHDTTVTAIQPAVTEAVIDINNTWKFLGYEQDEKTVEAADVEFLGHWVLEYTPTYDVNYEFVSGTPGMDLPDEIKNITPASDLDKFVDDIVDAVPPAQTQFKVNGGTWVFDGYNKDSVTITNSDELFTGTWKFIEDTYNVTYEYQSSTPSMTLPSEIVDMTPADDVDLINGTPVDAAHPTKTEVIVEDGKWTFDGYVDKDSVIINGQDEHFVGTWTYTPNPHKATYSFDSGTSGKTLPDEVKALLPNDPNTYYSGNDVTALVPTDTVIPVSDGRWVFTGYDSDSKTVQGKDVHFEGIWVFEETYEVTYQFESATPGMSLPAEVLNLLPSDTNRYDTDDTVTAVLPTETSVKVPGGTWTFKNYDNNSLIIENQNVLFTGYWEYTKEPTSGYHVVYEYVSGTPTKELPDEVKRLTPAVTINLVDGDRVTAVKPEKTEVRVSGGKWKFTTYDQNSLTIQGADGKFVGVWVFETDSNNSSNTPKNPQSGNKPKVPNTKDTVHLNFWSAMTVFSVLSAVAIKRRLK